MRYKVKKVYVPLIFIIDFIGHAIFFPFRLFKKRMQINKIKKILIIRLDNIGDILVTTPSIRALREKFKEARIDILVKSYTKDLVKNNPYIDNVIVFDSPWLHRKAKLNPFGSLKFFLKNELIKRLRSEKYDLALEFHTDPRNILLMFLIKARYRLGHAVRGLGFLLTHAVPYKENAHIVDKHAAIVECLGCSVKDKKTDLFIDAGTAIKMKKAAGKTGNKIICLNPGTGRLNKYWFNERWAKLADYLVERYDLDIAFTGDKNDLKDIDEIMGFMKNRKRCNVFAGKLSLLETSALIKNSRLMVSTDSGPLHLAKAVGTPVVGLYGPVNPVEWGYKDKKSAYVSGFNKCTCKYLPDCIRKTDRYLCMKSISVQDILKAVEGLKIAS